MAETKQRHPNVTNLEDIPAREQVHGKFSFKAKRLWPAAGGKKLACSWFEVPPGKQAFPHHFHSGFEEAIYILEGDAVARINNEKIKVGAGDYIAYPPGPDTAHSLLNVGSVPLRYLALSTVETLDIVVYPDSKKIAFAGGVDASKGLAAGNSWVRGIIKEQQSVDYYEGEDSTEQ
jgi:uncharacterized cupin superfamily protein